MNVLKSLACSNSTTMYNHIPNQDLPFIAKTVIENKSSKLECDRNTTEH